MKNILIYLLLTLSLSAHDQWIQVFSGDVVEQRFLQTIGNNGYESIVIEENNSSVVLIGAYISASSASKHLEDIKCNIAEDAFIRHYAYYPIETMPMTNSEEKLKIKSVENKLTIDEKCEDCKPVACICPKNKKHKRELEIGSALEFYKNSAHYNFIKN